ncbi:guanylate kinase [Parachitinimonas caeni]|uniref:Guanylate kinase n=1 Tax=Parachitinimonas caeni TaxID=3031301 RepID=A0ABT7DT55_9NEIS|nr:guanylate kinase [Parachitinimonas caeni]MDK2123256.1 guanylate kinase [Parachitinimonas caeni]
MNSGNIYVIAAPSGAGKTTLVLALLAAEPQVQLSISYTSRAPREGEVDGRDYHFVSRETFEAMIARGEFLESAEVYGNYYGTSQVWINEALAAGKDILLEIDTQGAAQVRRLFPQAISTFILPPSAEILEQRLRNRGKDSEDAIERRLKAAREEIAHVEEFDHIIVNEHIDEAVRDIIAIVRAGRLTLNRQVARHSELISKLKGA